MKLYFCAMKRKKEPFNKKSGKKVSFEDVVDMIGTPSEYHFAIIENGVDEELIDIARKAGIDITGYKHVIETSGTSHSQNRHGEDSNDRMPLSKEDYFLIPEIIRHRDSVIVSPSVTRIHKNPVFIYEKKIDEWYVYVEEIRRGRNKSLVFQSLRKRKAP